MPPTDTENTSTEMTDEQMDELIEQSEKPTNREIPMSAPKEEAPKDDPKAAGAQAPAQEYEITVQGKKIRAPLDKLLQWAGQGYNQPQVLQKFNQEKQAWESQRQQWEKQYSPYRQIDDWATKNPDKWQQLQQMWQSQAQGGAAQTNPAAQPAPLPPEFQQMREQVGQLTEFFQTQQQKQEDDALDREVQSIREKYKDLDWDSPDENGKSLEFKVLEHAKANGIAKFGTAFKDFYHDELISRAEAKAQQSVSQNIQKKTKLGILGESPIPQSKRQSFSQPKNIKQTSYEDLAAEALEEIRSTQAH